ncbi:MAG: F0F1 ATP synthase subunit epsilon [Rhizobiaceae bacterium]|jgi:F-type H+-transporting ATPase subunit epsilon
MAESFKFELVSPERLLVSEEVESVIVPGKEGEMTVLARHMPVMTTMRPGIITVKTTDGRTERYVVYGGFVDILPDSLTLLAEFSVHENDLDRADLTRRVQETRDQISQAESPEHRTKLEEFLHQLVTLENAMIPA